MKKDHIVLLSMIVGSRGSAEGVVGSDINLRHIVYHGDKRDEFGPLSNQFQYGTESIWILSWFFDKIMRFQWEPLEVLYGNPVNFLKFDPILYPIWQMRGSLLCHEMVDKIVERGMNEIKAGLRSKKPEHRYDGKQLARGFDMLSCARVLAEYGTMRPQGTNWIKRERLLNEKWKPSTIRNSMEKLLAVIHSIQQNQLRAPTTREIARGEEPRSIIPGTIRKERKKNLRCLFERAVYAVQGGMTGGKLTKSEKMTLLKEYDPSGRNRFITHPMEDEVVGRDVEVPSRIMDRDPNRPMELGRVRF